MKTTTFVYKLSIPAKGIPAECLEHIFEPLIQAGQDSSNYHKGAGLGLSISRQLIEANGWLAVRK